MTNPGVRVMVVGNDEGQSSFIAGVLTKEGYEVALVSDSRQAIARAEAITPHVFIFDLEMAPPDGFQLCRMLRAHRSFRYAPVLIVTDLDPTDSKIVAIGAEANDYLVKPFSAKMLLAKVEDLSQGFSEPEIS
jgi:two-component system OmpR family response regulator